MFEVSAYVPVDYFPQYSTLTPLMFAAKIDDTRSMLQLLERGARVNERNRQGWTALHFAAYDANHKCCEILRLWGADHRAKTKGKKRLQPSNFAHSMKALEILS
jgi:hypothetical protein